MVACAAPSRLAQQRWASPWSSWASPCNAVVRCSTSLDRSVWRWATACVGIRPVGPTSAQVRSKRSRLSQERYALVASLSAAERAVGARSRHRVTAAICRHQPDQAAAEIRSLLDKLVVIV